MTKTLATLALASSLLACSHDRVIAVHTGGELPKMTVTGTATLEVAPDCADLTMTLSVDAPKPIAATTGVDGKETALVAALTAAGVARDDVKLSTLSLEPVYAPNPATPWAPYVMHGYRASIVVTATTRDFAKIATLMETGARAGATAMTSQLRRSDLPELKKKVRDMALAAAQDKAKQTASGLGIKLGRVINVAETPAGSMWNNSYFPQAANSMETRSAPTTLGGTLLPLSLDITIGYELAKTT
jgi:uncharacterized protein YggE